MARISQLLLIRKVKFASFAIQYHPTISNSTKLHFNSTKILLQPYIHYILFSYNRYNMIIIVPISCNKLIYSTTIVFLVISLEKGSMSYIGL
jgi:hypothetical protein